MMSDVNHASFQRDNAILKQFLANMRGGVLVEDASRNIIFVNQALCDMLTLQTEPSSLIGENSMHALAPKSSLFVDEKAFVDVGALLDGRVSVMGVTLILQDGRIFSRDYMPLADDAGFIGHGWHYQDITDVTHNHKRLERLLEIERANKEINRLFLRLDDIDEALNRSLTLTGQLLDVSRVYVFRIRQHERVIDNTHEWCAPDVKPEIQNLQGIPFDEFLPSFFPMMAEYDLIAPYHISELPEDLRALLEPQDIQSVLWLPIYFNDRIEGFVGYDEVRHPRHWLPEEITIGRIVMENYARALERQNASNMLIQARDEAIRIAQLRGQFVANMSHEIRTPMTGVLGMLQLILETQLDALQRELASDALNSASRLLAIINDILDFSKLEAGQVTLESDIIDLRAIMLEVKMTLMPQINQKSLTLTLDMDDDIPYRVYGDATRIRQVLMNLVSNAVKFTHQGHIILSARLIHKVDKQVSLRFSVEDTGIGIAQDKLDIIFDDFVQGDGSMTRQYGGSGLGLSISRQLVELMNSRIEVQSEPNKGSTFSFMLHLTIAKASSDIDSSALIQFEHLRVAIIDDNRTARHVLKQSLEQWGIQVISMDYGETLPTDASFDILFRRYSSMPTPTMPPVKAKHIVYLTDANTPVFMDDSLSLTLPIDQSRLYSLILGITQTNPPA